MKLRKGDLEVILDNENTIAGYKDGGWEEVEEKSSTTAPVEKKPRKAKAKTE